MSLLFLSSPLANEPKRMIERTLTCDLSSLETSSNNLLIERLRPKPRPATRAESEAENKRTRRESGQREL